VVSEAVTFAVPGDLATPTGGYAYDRRMIGELAALGFAIEVIDLGDGFPQPGAQRLAAAQAQLAAVPAGRPIIIDGLAFGVLPQAAATLAPHHPLIALVHHPLALETGLTPAQAADLRASERAALACARHVVATSPATARLLVSDYGVSPACLTVALPGTDRIVGNGGAAAVASRGASDVMLLAVGSVVPRKGYDVLVAALATLADLPWRLTIVGDCTRDAAAAERLRQAITGARLDDRVILAGAVAQEQLDAHYGAADVFVLPSRHEGYGMAFAEAIAHGLPVVGTTAGAIPETVPAGAGVLVPPGDAGELAVALRRLIADDRVRATLASAARAAAAGLPSWADAAKTFAGAIRAVR
jgi:glycosyltransferase involved in cell wall biosynthesis